MELKLVVPLLREHEPFCANLVCSYYTTYSVPKRVISEIRNVALRGQLLDILCQPVLAGSSNLHPTDSGDLGLSTNCDYRLGTAPTL